MPGAVLITIGSPGQTLEDPGHIPEDPGHNPEAPALNLVTGNQGQTPLTKNNSPSSQTTQTMLPGKFTNSGPKLLPPKLLPPKLLPSKLLPAKTSHTPQFQTVTPDYYPDQPQSQTLANLSALQHGVNA